MNARITTISELGLTTESALQDESVPEIRDIESITLELLAYKNQYVKSAYEIGRLLLEAKDQLEHGQWLDWLQDRINFSERTAHRFMQLAKGYPDSSTLANLGYSKALCLLALPEVERSAFMRKPHEVKGVEKSIEKMSARELKDAVQKEKNKNKNETATDTPAVHNTPKPAESRKSDNELQYVQECIDSMLDSIEKLIDNPASYSDLTTSLCSLCEEILLRLTSAELDVS